MDFDNSFDIIVPDIQPTITIGGVAGLVFPSGTVAQRNSTANGTIRFNLDGNLPETYVNTRYLYFKLSPSLVTTGINAAGNAYNTATALVSDFNVVAAADGWNNGVSLPDYVISQLVGRTVTIYNDTAELLWVYPQSGGTIDGQSPNAGVNLAAYKTIVLTQLDLTRWATVSNTSAVGGGGAPTGSSYITINTDASLTGERSLQGTPYQINLIDGGANGNVTISIPQDARIADSVRATNSGGYAEMSYNKLVMGEAKLESSGQYTTLRQIGGTFGATSLTLQNEHGINGVLLKQESGLPLIDFGMACASNTYVNILRMEHRGGYGFAENTKGEYQFILDSTGTAHRPFVIGHGKIQSDVPTTFTNNVVLGTDGGNTITVNGQLSVNSSVGTIGQVLMSRGVGQSPEWSSTATAGAPANASYITLASNATLTNERVLTGGSGIAVADGGATAASVVVKRSSTLIPDVFVLPNALTSSGFHLVMSDRSAGDFYVASTTSARLTHTFTTAGTTHNRHRRVEQYVTPHAITHSSPLTPAYVDGCVWGATADLVNYQWMPVWLPESGTSITCGDARFPSGLPVSSTWGAIESDYNSGTTLFIYPKSGTTGIHGTFTGTTNPPTGTSFTSVTVPTLGGDVFKLVHDGTYWMAFTRTSATAGYATVPTGTWSTRASMPNDIVDVVATLGAIVMVRTSRQVTVTSSGGLITQTIASVFDYSFFIAGAGMQTYLTAALCERAGIIYLAVLYAGIYNVVRIYRSDTKGQTWELQSVIGGASTANPTHIRLPGDGWGGSGFDVAFHDRSNSLAITHASGFTLIGISDLASYRSTYTIPTDATTAAERASPYFWKSAHRWMDIDDVEHPVIAVPWEDFPTYIQAGTIAIMNKYTAGLAPGYAMYSGIIDTDGEYASMTEITVPGTAGTGILSGAYKHGSGKIAAFVDDNPATTSSVVYTTDGLTAYRVALDAAYYGYICYDPVNAVFVVLRMNGGDGMYSSDCTTWTSFSTGIPSYGMSPTPNTSGGRFTCGFFAGSFYIAFYHKDCNSTTMYVRKSVAGNPGAVFTTMSVPGAASSDGMSHDLTISNQGLLGFYTGTEAFSSRDMVAVEEFSVAPYVGAEYYVALIGDVGMVVNDMPVYMGSTSTCNIAMTPDLGRTWIQVTDVDRLPVNMNYIAAVTTSPSSPLRAGYCQLFTKRFPYGLMEYNFSPAKGLIRQERVVVLDFGTVPVNSKTFTITAVGVTVGSEFTFSPLPNQRLVGKSTDELEMDTFFGHGRCTSAATFTDFPIITVTIHAYPGPVQGKYVFVYTPK